MKAVFLLLFMFNMQLNAQTNSKNNFDVVKTYLLEIQQAVDYAPNSKKEKIDKLNKVIRQGTEQRRMLKQALKNTKSKQQQDEILRDFNLILQAVVLLKTDINENVPLSQDIDYLNKMLPALLRKL
ncbi:hypothetical protein [Sphingobacterium hotanense]|uniref:hypothetical protein n=1 Tax=Sphingobacterium hotanense TaxID=649196 RepID=UPI0021A686E6|nr:hypothetical protein [Sphingobacterium hotanense]MCT1526354.1 hypothetical protein [Sphingobacterium hotanense]